MKASFLILLLLQLDLHGILTTQPETHAILISTSKYWFNLRQAANILMIYHKLRSFGIPDKNIILMIPENTACNPRNNDPGVVSCYDGSSYPNLFRDLEIDYKGLDVNVENILNLIRGRYSKEVSESKKLRNNENTRLLIYLTGHGGNQYSKIQDTHVIGSYEYAKVIQELYEKGLYKEILAINDSCEAVTIWDEIISPNIFAIGSSPQGLRSYSLGHDNQIFLSKTDKFSFKVNEFLSEKFSKDSSLTVKHLLDYLEPEFLGNKPDWRNYHAKKTEKEILLRDFFTNTRPPLERQNLPADDPDSQNLRSLLSSVVISDGDFIL